LSKKYEPAVIFAEAGIRGKTGCPWNNTQELCHGLSRNYLIHHIFALPSASNRSTSNKNADKSASYSKSTVIPAHRESKGRPDAGLRPA